MKHVFAISIAAAVAALSQSPVLAQQYQQPYPQQQHYQPQYQQPNQQQLQYQPQYQQGGGGLPIVPKGNFNSGPYYQGGALFDVRPADATVRDVLVRWSSQTGWVHKPEHWAIDRDLPISGAADPSVFGFEFKGAVRKLLASSELTDRPVQPCFYSNHVVRVISKAELCDKNNQ